MDYELLGKVNFTWDSSGSKFHHNIEYKNKLDPIQEENILSFSILAVFSMLLGHFYISNSLDICQDIIDCLEKRKVLYCPIDPAIRSISIEICKSNTTFGKLLPYHLATPAT
jgi:hypothetical protein